MDDSPHCLNHGNRRFGLENIAPHIDPGGAFLNRVIGHSQSVQFRYLLAAGHDDRHRAGCGDGLEIFIYIVSFDVVGAKLRAYPASQPEILRVPGHILAYRCHRESRNAVTVADINHFGHIDDGLPSHIHRR